MKIKSHIYRVIIPLFLFFFLWHGAAASKLNQGFDALKMRDYFRSKKTFESILKKKADPYASYGLAVIFFRNDNPYANLDSAAKYVNLSYNVYRSKPKAKTIAEFSIDSLSILNLADSISMKMMTVVKRVNTITAYNKFLLINPAGNKKLRETVVYLRDELEFNHLLEINKSDSTEYFLVTHPQSDFFMEASLLKDRQIFDEYTMGMRAETYRSFIKKYAKNVMVNTAYEKLFAIYKQNSDVKGLAEFVKDFPKALQAVEAWKLLFSLSVKSFSNEELTRFLEMYPDFPFRESILKELELNKLVLFPFQKEDLFGFINNQGKIIISPVYDEVTEFYEGLSVVNKNDTVFFINKENENPFNVTYSAAYRFQNGMAPVKKNNKWHFINRQGQTISRTYDEIAELSGSAYVVRLKDKYGALDNFGQPIFEPKFEKLGDFMNGCAYYTENGKSGFVNKTGNVHKAEFDWISDFDPEGMAIVKTNQKYGLINATGQRILPAQYDKVLRGPAGVYLVVLAGNYGFFSSDSCFLTPISYEYSFEKQPDYYTDGILFKAQRKAEKALINTNGTYLVPFGQYSDINFPSCGLMRVGMETKRELKYGYINTKLSTVIPLKYAQALDFVDSTAIVKYRDKTMVINTSGMELFSSDFSIDRLSARYFMVNDDARRIIDKQGRLIFSDVVSTQRIKTDLLAVILYNGEIKLLYD